MKKRRVDLSFVPADVLVIMDNLHRSGFKVWLVGGVLRDLLLGLEPKDFDLSTDAPPSRLIELFQRVVPIGIRHGTVQVQTPARGVEITSTAVQGEWDMDADLGRRDFTMNAIALSYPEGQLLDPFNGIKDLQARILRGVRDARSRFREDPLRTLRAVRFVGVYGFVIEENTFRAIQEESPGLERVANERIREEVFKLIMGEHALEAFELMRLGGVLREVMPELLEGFNRKQESYHRYDIYRHTIHTVQNSPRRLEVRLAGLFNAIAKPRVRVRTSTGECRFPDAAKASRLLAEEIMNRWLASGRIIAHVGAVVENQLPMGIGKWTDHDVRRFLARVGLEPVNDIIDLARAERLCHTDRDASLEELETFRRRIDEQLERRVPLSIKELAVSGEDIMRSLGLRQGPEVGRMLKKLLDEVLREPDLNDHKILMDFLRKE